MRRPLQYPKLAPNPGLVMGSSIVNGVNQALQNYQRMKMQRMQMQNMQMQAQGMNAYRQAQAQALQQRYSPANVDKVDYQLAMMRAKKDPNNISAQDQQTIRSYSQKADAAGVPVDQALNMKESDLYKSAMLNQSRENVAGINAGARTDSAQTMADSRVESAHIRANAPSKAPGAQMSPQDKMEYQNLSRQQQKTHDALLSLDKPPALGVAPMDDTAKQHLRDNYTQQINDYGQQMQAITSRGRGGQGGAGQQPSASAPAAPQTAEAPPQIRQFSWDDRDKAGANDVVINRSGIPMTKGAKGGWEFHPSATGSAGQQPSQSQGPITSPPQMMDLPPNPGSAPPAQNVNPSIMQPGVSGVGAGS